MSLVKLNLLASGDIGRDGEDADDADDEANELRDNKGCTIASSSRQARKTRAQQWLVKVKKMFQSNSHLKGVSGAAKHCVVSAAIAILIQD